jgi:hypothetical protein
MGLFSVAKADIYLYATQNTGSSVARSAPAPDMNIAEVEDSPGSNGYLTGVYGSNTTLHVSVDTTVAKGTYLVGIVSLDWVDIEDVYIVIQ